MSAEEQQTQEIEALQAIFQPDEFEALEAEYPNISVQFILSSNQSSSESDDDFTLKFVVSLPSEYPEVIPEMRFEDWEEEFEESAIQGVLKRLREVAEENLGMVMIFSVISALQEEIGSLAEERRKAADRKLDLERERKEEKENKKFHGTPATMENFKKWKEGFDKERLAAKQKQIKEQEALLAGRLTGRQQFMRDATLNLSDVALMDDAVNIDESLFDDDELEGLDLEDSDLD